MNTCVIETSDLTVYYGRQRGIQNLNLAVQEGEVYGFLGPNGAGKTTTLRVLLDIIRPTNGKAYLFGLDCQKEGAQARKRIGYTPGELSLYPHMQGDQYLDMVDSIRGNTADPQYRRELCARLDLDTRRRMRDYSRGNKQKVGLVAAFMGQPDLLILDEPSAGLDPLVQQTVLELVREAKAGGRTVFFSSHVLPEVQAVCDRVGIIRDGQLVATERVESLIKQQFLRLHLSFARTPPAGAFIFEGVTEVSRHDQNIILEIRESLNAVLAAAVEYQVTNIETHPVTLEEVFLAFYGNHRGGNHA